MNAYAMIVRQEGIGRNAIINAAELASYNQVKQPLFKLPGFKNDVVTRILSGFGARLFAVCVGSPIDVVRCLPCSMINYDSRLPGDVLLLDRL